MVCIVPLLRGQDLYFLHSEDVRLGYEHAVSIDDVSAAYPLLDVIDHAKSRAAVRIIYYFI